MQAWTANVRNYLSGQWSALWRSVVEPRFEGTADGVADRARLAAPVVWLIGKVQSGKTSVVRALTGATDAEIGSGFQRCTTTARVFDFPSDAPVIRFLDTRGLGETGYRADEDIAFAEAQSHLLLVVMKAMDTQQSEIFAVLREVRGRHPEWPVVVAQTSLHEGYGVGQDHDLSYPFDDAGVPDAAAGRLSDDLVRSLAWQRDQLATLPGTGAVRFVPIDFTRPGDGFHPLNFGLDALLAAFEAAAPASLSAAVRSAGSADQDRRRAQAHPHVLGYATAAAVADLFPATGLVAVPGIQAKMLHSIAGIYDMSWTQRLAGEFAGALGTGTILRIASGFGARELGKLVPVYGQTAGAAAAAALSFATTFALGKAACHFLGRRRAGLEDDEGQVMDAYKRAFASAVEMARQRDFTMGKS